MGIEQSVAVIIITEKQTFESIGDREKERQRQRKTNTNTAHASQLQLSMCIFLMRSSVVRWDFLFISFNSIGDQINVIVTRNFFSIWCEGSNKEKRKKKKQTTNAKKKQTHIARKNTKPWIIQNKFLMPITSSYDNFNHNGHDVITNFDIEKLKRICSTNFFLSWCFSSNECFN